LRVNLGAGFTDLFTDEGSRIIATFKVSKDGKLGLFYKEDVQSLYCLRKKSAIYVEGHVTAVNANPTTLLRRIIIDAPTTIYL
jgi:hypothetical protein